MVTKRYPLLFKTNISDYTLNGNGYITVYNNYFKGNRYKYNMINNDMLRRLRFSFEYNDKKMQSIFALADCKITHEQLHAWLKKEDDSGFILLPDKNFAYFLDGMIYLHRGKKEDMVRAPEKTLTNNIILTKLKIALNLKAEEIIELMEKVNFSISKPELSAMFRKTEHQHYRKCGDQFLRNFLKAIQLKYRESPLPVAVVTAAEDTNQKEEAKAPHRASYTTTKPKAKSTPNTNKTTRTKTSEIYRNPNAKPVEKERKVLKLKPEDIWKNND